MEKEGDYSLIRLKRVYEEPSRGDGLRVLVERLWPRGVSKERAAIDLWVKELAPSTELRKWFSHDLEKWDEFCTRYRAELEQRGEPLAELQARVAKGPVTFVFAASDPEHNSALVLKGFLEERM